MMTKTVYLGCDHAGFLIKESVLKAAKEAGFEIVDLGTNSPDSVDYPDFVLKVVKALEEHPEALGVLMCGTGIGMSIAANRFKHIRAALCHLPFEAEVARKHNHANILCLGGRTLESALAAELTRIFLTTAFEGERHQRRIDKIDSFLC